MKKILFLIVILIGSIQPYSGYSLDLISVEIKGKGKPIILIHGMACSSAVWDELVDKHQANYQFHLVNIKGFGNGAFVKKDHYLASVRDEVVAYIQQSNLHKPVLMGHSMGGFLGLWIAATQPDLLQKVISVDGVPYFPVLQMPGITPELAKQITAQFQESMSRQTPAQTEQNQRMMLASMIATESKIEKVYQMGARSNSDIIGQAFAEMYTTDLRPLMTQIKIPVLVFGSWAAYKAYSTEDQVKANYQDQLKDIKNVQFALAKNAYHFVFYDEPEWFNQQMVSFLQN
jgi:pimeloyl-ACP methyl ester carboxylesterase